MERHIGLDHRRLLLWCLGGGVLVYLLLASAGGAPGLALSASFRSLLSFDVRANLVLLALALAAFALRRRSNALFAIARWTSRPWLIAAAAFPLLALGSFYAYHAHPLSMDEYAPLFQAQAFAAGKLAGSFPPDLLDRLIPPFLQNHFLTVSRSTGEVSSTYRPGFALLLTPFVWLGVPWAANPALGALSIPLLHRLARDITRSRDAAGWAVALMLASPAFLAGAISYYSMQAHLLFNLTFALLLMQPSPGRVAAAGLVGSFALALHNPVPHLLFGAPFIVWLVLRPGSARLVVTLLAAYLPLALVLGFGWQRHLDGLRTAATLTAAAAGSGGATALETAWSTLAGALTFPTLDTMYARLLGISKLWTWGAPGLVVLAACGLGDLRSSVHLRLLAAALLLTLVGYFFVRFDQGHGWAYRYAHAAWFVLPLLAGACLAACSGRGSEIAGMTAWGVALALVFANGLRLVQIERFIDVHRAQVPPLAQAPDARRPEVVFVNIRRGFYTHDLVQNDPFLRAPRVVMTYEGGAGQSALMASRFPGYARTGQGEWGEVWAAIPGKR